MEPEQRLADHRVLIHNYALDLAEELETALDPRTEDGSFTIDGEHYADAWQYLDSRVLAVDVFRQVDTAAPAVLVEWLLTCGGPTVRIRWDSRYNGGELHHSWGKDPAGNDQDRTSFPGHLCELLADHYGADPQ